MAYILPRVPILANNQYLQWQDNTGAVKSVITLNNNNDFIIQNANVVLSGGKSSYNSVFGSASGHRLEEATTNLVTNPGFEVDTSGWTATQATLSTNASAKVIGSLGLKILAAASGASQRPTAESTSAITVVNSTVYTASCYAQKASGSGSNWAIFGNRTGANNYAWFDLVNGVVGTQTGCTATIQDVSALLGAGWYRLTVTYTQTGTSAKAYYEMAGADNSTAGFTGASQFHYIDAVQLEAKSYATTYCDGSLGPGYTWAGTAWASTSSRVGGGLVQDGNLTTLTNLGNLGVNGVGNSYFAGRLGIGVTSPHATLDVGGSISSNSPVVGIGGPAAGAAMTALNLTNTSSQAAGNAVDINFTGAVDWMARIEGGFNASASDGYLAFHASLGGTLHEYMRITSTGAIGIGITAPASGVSLHINQPTTSASAYLLLTNTTTGTTNGFYIGAGGGSLDAVLSNAANGGIVFATNGSTVMKLDNAGTLGIGITSSFLSTRLHIKGAASQLAIEGTAADAQVRFKNTTTSDTYISASAARLYFFIANSGAPTVSLVDGKLGLGSAFAPLTQLHITGDWQVGTTGGAASSAKFFFAGSGNSGYYQTYTNDGWQTFVNSHLLLTQYDAGTGSKIGFNISTPLTTMDWIDPSGVIVNLCGHNDTSALSTDVLLGEVRGDSSYSNARSASHSAASIQFRTDPSTWYLGYISFRTNNSDATNSAAVERLRLTSDGTLRSPSLSMGSLSAGAVDIANKFWFAGEANTGYYMRWNTTAGKMEWVTNSNTILTIGLGIVGIGPFTTASHMLQLQADDAAKPTTSTWSIVSDATAKEDVEPYKRGMDVLRKLEPKQFRFNGLYATEAGAHGVSLLAQDAVEHAPELFKWHEVPKPTALMKVGHHSRSVSVQSDYQESHWTMNLHAMFFMLLNAVKELDARLENLEHPGSTTNV